MFVRFTDSFKCMFFHLVKYVYKSCISAISIAVGLFHSALSLAIHIDNLDPHGYNQALSTTTFNKFKSTISTSLIILDVIQSMEMVHSNWPHLGRFSSCANLSQNFPTGYSVNFFELWSTIDRYLERSGSASDNKSNEYC